MNKIWQDEAWEDFEYWMKQDKKLSSVFSNYCKILIEMYMKQ